jgi:peptidyl-prolyl cis-trans isomerase SDCCAG10
LQAQIKKLQGDIKQIGAPKAQPAPEPAKYKGSVAKLRDEFLKSGKAIAATRKDAKGDIDSKLGAFNAALKQAAKEAKSKSKKDAKTSDNAENTWECSLHFIKNCSSCRDTFGEQVSEDDDDWMNASLKFEKEVGANVYQPKIDDYTVVDPRQGYNFLDISAKSDPFGRDIQVLGDIQSRKTKIWTEKSTRQIRPVVDQAKEAPEYQRYK